MPKKTVTLIWQKDNEGGRPAGYREEWDKWDRQRIRAWLMVGWVILELEDGSTFDRAALIASEKAQREAKHSAVEQPPADRSVPSPKGREPLTTESFRPTGPQKGGGGAAEPLDEVETAEDEVEEQTTDEDEDEG